MESYWSVETLVAYLILLALVGLLTLLVRHMRASRPVTVAEEHAAAGGSPERLTTAVRTAVAGRRAFRVMDVRPGHVVVVAPPSPPLAILGAFTLFPVGLALLSIRQEHRLDVLLEQRPAGTAVALHGRTELNVLELLRRSLASGVPASG